MGVYPITLGVGVSRSVSNNIWVFLEWDHIAALGPGEHAYIAGGPNGNEPIIVDNGLYVNGQKYPSTFSGTLSDPMAHLGQAAATCYTDVPAIDVTRGARADSAWHVQAIDWGYTYASSPLYLVIK